VQYLGVRASIDSDFDNVATLMRMPGLLPRGIGIGPLLAEAQHLARCDGLLGGSEMFALPTLHTGLCTPQVLALDFMDSTPLDSLVDAPQAVRDRVAGALIDLVLRELFVFGAMQTDPNLANYRYDPKSGLIVLLDFGAVWPVAPNIAADFRALAHVALKGGAAETRDAMLRIGYIGPATAAHHHDLIQTMFDTAMAPFQQDTPFDFGASDLLERVSGMYLMAAKLRARFALRLLVEAYCGKTAQAG
jgi:predicted unusual protein kinase regulating ubiquinone biosynthesis (AarF/ABC1/UbiB family)